MMEEFPPETVLRFISTMQIRGKEYLVYIIKVEEEK